MVSERGSGLASAPNSTPTLVVVIKRMEILAKEGNSPVCCAEHCTEKNLVFFSKVIQKRKKVSVSKLKGDHPLSL